MQAKIISTGSYIPKKVLTNSDLEKMVDTSNEWIMTRTGIEKRHIAGSDEYTSDMGIAAAKEALDQAGMKGDDLDLIMVATLTPDYIFPSTACIIQKKLKSKAAAFDLQAACSGYIYALLLAKSLIESGAYKNILIVASEKLSSIVDYKDRRTCVLFGDGAAAALVSSKGNGFDIRGVCLGADGKQSDLLILPAGGCREPASFDSVKGRRHYIRMEGGEVFKHAVRSMERASRDCLRKLGLEESDVDWFIPHQANERIINAVAKRFSHLPDDRIYRKAVREYGNTSASSVGIALDDLNRTGMVKGGDNVLLTAFGAGFTWGAALITKSEN